MSYSQHGHTAPSLEGLEVSLSQSGSFSSLRPPRVPQQPGWPSVGCGDHRRLLPSGAPSTHGLGLGLGPAHQPHGQQHGNTGSHSPCHCAVQLWLMEMECRGFKKQSEVWSQDSFLDGMLFLPALCLLREAGRAAAPAPKVACPDLRGSAAFFSSCCLFTFLTSRMR